MADMPSAVLRLLGLHIAVVWLAMALVLVLRPLLLRQLGAQATAALWVVVPAAAAGVWIPGLALGQAPPMQWMNVVAPASAHLPLMDLLATASALTSQQFQVVVLLVWLTGALCTATLLARRQHLLWQSLRFVPGRAHGYLPAASSPAVVGVWRPRLALPVDFEMRFNADERQLILTHERMHLLRHDNHCSLLACTLATAQWFNPLAWWALNRFRVDQELACDADTLARTGAATRAAYIRALLKAHGLVPLLAPAAMGWRGTHPLVERIAMLQTTPPTRTQRLLGRILVVALGVLALSVAHTQQATPALREDAAGRVMLFVDIELDGKPIASPRLFGPLGKVMSVRWRDDTAGPAALPWELQVTPSALDSRQIRLQARLSSGEPLQPLATPVLVTAAGQTVRFEARSADDLRTVGISMRAERATAPDVSPGLSRGRSGSN